MDALTAAIEGLVGVACIGLGIVAWRRMGIGRVVGAVFAAAGLAAVVRGAVSIAV